MHRLPLLFLQRETENYYATLAYALTITQENLRLFMITTNRSSMTEKRCIMRCFTPWGRNVIMRRRKRQFVSLTMNCRKEQW